MGLKNITEDRYTGGKKEKLLKFSIVGLIIAVGIGLFIFGDEDEEISVSSAENDWITEGNMKEKTEETSFLIVDVGGAVKDPDVVELDSGSRVEDAIDAAGGLTADADTTEINRAAKIEDGQKIYIPFRGKADPTSPNSESTGGSNAGKVNINLADSTALQTLYRIGPVTAEKILEYREKHGNFKKITDLKKVDGIGDKIFEKIKDEVCL